MNKWQTYKIKDLTQSFSGGTPLTDRPEFYQNGDIPFITSSDLNQQFIDSVPHYITKQGLESSSAKIVEPQTLLLALYGATAGTAAITHIRGAINQAILAFSKSKIDIKFLYYLLCEKKPYILHTYTQGGQPNLSAQIVNNLSIYIPTDCHEQQKIVEVLETWDKAIQLTRELIEQKELQKKGLLQQLVYKQPKTVSYFLRQLFTLGRGRVISKEEIALHPGAYPVYSSQTADNGVLGFINTFDFDGEYITWTTDGANAGKVFYRTGKFNCTNVCGTAQLKQKNQHNLYYIMSYLNNVTKKYVSYVGNPKLMNGVFANILIALPSKELQDKAAALLTTLDKDIDVLRQKLAKLEEQKKGLMQVLLTGKVRIPLRGGIHG